MQNPPFIRARSRLKTPKIPAPLRLAHSVLDCGGKRGATPL
jgi:hypothetical protein